MMASSGGGVARLARRHAFALLLVAGLGLRFAIAYLLFPEQGFAGDLREHLGWMPVLARFGPNGYYANVREALPPGFLWILWPLGVLAGAASSVGLPTEQVAAALVKLPAMVADGLLAFLLYRAVGGWNGRQAGLIAAGLFLFIPVMWYESALWGQIDSIGSLFVLGALVFLIGGWSEAAAGSAVVATLVKPQFGVVLLVVGLVLLRRHLFLPGSGPRPKIPPWIPAWLRRWLPAWLREEQGPRRLVSSALVGLAVAMLIVVPFDLEDRAPAALAGIPLVGDTAGIIALMQQELGAPTPLTANAYNPWALVGPAPLAARGIGGWTQDSLRMVDGVSAFSVGLVLLLATSALVGWQLLRRDGRTSILFASTVLVVAVFVLPTRVHERYVFPAFAIAAPLAATSRSWRAWYMLLGVVAVANLHAVLTHGGTAGVVHLPGGDLVRTEAAVWVIALTYAALFAWAAWQIRPRSYTAAAGRAEARRGSQDDVDDVDAGTERGGHPDRGPDPPVRQAGRPVRARP